MNGLTLTGSIGILARYQQELQPDFSLVEAVERMRNRGIRLGENIRGCCRLVNTHWHENKKLTSLA